jgi:cyclic pyranopterin phosphate synthase
VSPLTHLDETGAARMVDISAKPLTVREAEAQGLVRMSKVTRDLAMSGQGPKGDVLRVAEIAGIMAAKRTADLIPLCHPLPLTRCEVKVSEAREGLKVTALASTTAATGVEMEALTAVSVACLTLYDMLKAAERGMVIEAVRLVRKSGGRSGDFRAP